MRGGISGLGLVVLLSFVGCGAYEGAPQQPTVIGGGAVVIVFNDRGPVELPFNPRGERLMTATDQLAAAVGHPVTIELDMALLPQWATTFENALATSIENVARDLRALKERRPEVYGFAVPKLQRIDCSYDASAEGTTARFDDRQGTLYVSGPAAKVVTASVQPTGPAAALIEPGIVHDALRQGYTSYLVRRFDGVTPEQAPADALRLYWQYLDLAPAFHQSPSSAKGMANEPEALGIEYKVRFAARVPASDADLRAEVRREVIGSARYFGGAYQRDPDKLEKLPGDSTWRRAEAAWMRWFNANAQGLSDAERLNLLFAPLYARSVSLPSGLPRYPETGGFFPSAYPGVDRLGFGLQIVDRWISAGHPVGADADRRGSLFDFLICPYTRDTLGAQSVVGGRCESGLYSYAAGTPNERQRLIDAVSKRNDEAFTKSVMLNLIKDGRGYTPQLMEIWRGLEPNRSMWAAATKVIAEAAMGGSGPTPAELYDESLRLWRRYPERRGAVLYLLTSLERYNMVRPGLVNWPQFDAIFGSKIGAPELATYLSMSPMAVSNVAGLWEALAPGYSRAALIVPKLDTYIDDRTTKVYDSTSPRGPLKDITSRLCAEHAEQDRAQLQAYFRALIAERPSEEKRFGLLVDLNAPGRCAASAP